MDLDNVFTDHNDEVQKTIRDYWIIIDSFTVNCDGSINVDGSVKFPECLGSLNELPLNFDKVTGDFDCSKLNLKTLKGSPSIVGGTFNCSYNQLTTLEYLPKKGKCLIVDNMISSIYTSNTGNEFEEVLLLFITDYGENSLPKQIADNALWLNVIFKYQHFFNVYAVYDDCITFNPNSFDLLVSDIKEGLK